MYYRELIKLLMFNQFMSYFSFQCVRLNLTICTVNGLLHGFFFFFGRKKKKKNLTQFSIVLPFFSIVLLFLFLTK
jgi:hypothetical protein